MNTEIKKVVARVKEAQIQLQKLVKSHDWVEEARKYAERQGKEVKKLFAPDVEKMKGFLEREKKELERFQKQIPGEVKKFKKFVNLQKKEFENLLNNVRKMSETFSGKGSSRRKKITSKKTAPRKTAPRKITPRKITKKPQSSNVQEKTDIEGSSISSTTE